MTVLEEGDVIHSQAELEAFSFELTIFELKCAEEVSELISSFEEASPEAVKIAINNLVAEFEESQNNKASKLSVMRLLVRLIGDRRYQKKVGLDEMIEAALSSAVSIDKSLLVELHCQLMKLKLKTDKRTQDTALTVSLHLIGDLISDESAYQRGRALTKKVTTCLFSFEGVQELCYSLWIDKVAIFYILPWVWKKDTGKDSMPTLLGAFNAMVLSAKQRLPSSLHIAVTSYFMGRIEDADFALEYRGGEGSVSEALLKMIKKDAEGAAYLVSTVVAKLSPTLNLASFSTSGGLAGALRLLKSTKAGCRVLGHDLFLSLCGRCRADPAALTGAVNQLFDALVVRSEPSSSRSSAAACLVSLCKDYPALASAIAAKGCTQVHKGMLGLATYMDKENDRACGVMLGRVLGCWMLVLSSLPNGDGVEEGNPLVSQVFQQKIEAGLKAAKGTLPALVALSETIIEGDTKVGVYLENIFATLLIIARKASTSTVSEATLALTVLLRMPSLSMKLVDKSACWSSFTDPTSFLHYLPVAGTASGSVETNEVEEASLTTELPARLRQGMWRLDGNQVIQAIAGQGRAFCLQILVEKGKIRVLTPKTAVQTESERALDVTAVQFSSLMQLTNHVMAADDHSCATLDSPCFEQSIVCCMLSASREVREYTFAKLLERRFVAPLVVSEALQRHLDAYPQGYYPHNRVEEAAIKILAMAELELSSDGLTEMGPLFVSIVALASHAFVSDFSLKRAKQLLSKVSALFMGKFDAKELLEVQSRMTRLIVTSAVDMKKCTRWRASALSSALPILKVAEDFPLVTEKVLQALIAAVKDCELTTQKEEVWKQLLDMARKVGCPDYEGVSKTAAATAPATISAPVAAPAPPQATRRERRKVVDDDDDDDFLSRVKSKQSAKKEGVSPVPAPTPTTTIAAVKPPSVGTAGKTGSGLTRVWKDWDADIDTATRTEVLRSHARLVCACRLLEVIKHLCCSSPEASREEAHLLTSGLGSLLSIAPLPSSFPPYYPSVQTVVFDLFSDVVKSGLAAKEPLLSSPAKLIGTMLYAYSKAGLGTLAAAEKRIESSLSTSGDGGSATPARAGASLVIIPAGVVGLLKELSTAVQSGEGLREPASLAFLLPILTNVLQVQHDGRLPGWKASYHILASFVTDILCPETCRAKLVRDLVPGVTRLLLHSVVKATDTKMVPKPSELLSKITAVSLVVDLPLDSLKVRDGGLFSPLKASRTVCVQALYQVLSSLQEESLPIKNNLDTLLQPLWILRHDEDDDLSKAAREVWTLWSSQVQGSTGGITPENYLQLSTSLFEFEASSARTAASRAVKDGIGLYPLTAEDTVKTLKELYVMSLPPKLDMSLLRNRRAAAANNLPEDKFVRTRLCVALTLENLGTLRGEGASLDLLTEAIRFLSGTAATDPSFLVRQAVVLAGKGLINAVGELYDPASLLMFFEKELKAPADKALTEDEQDYRHECLVILLGTTGKYLKKDIDTLTSIVKMLVKELTTPSETVQEAVADCLVPLVQVVKETDLAKDTLELLLSDVTSAASYGDRRGAAFGIGAFVKGMGIAVLKGHNIVTRLKDAAEKGSPQSRQGALAAFECLCARLGFLFEPYVIVIFPVMLKCVSNSNDLVRDGAKNTLSVIMNKLTAHGMRQVLAPVLNELISESQWKTRAEATRLLGYIVQCASKQVASSLPQIVESITEALSDPHPKVKDAAKQAMSDVSGSIRNPELGRISGNLVGALSDPANKTKTALDALLQCEFVHSIDASSLAILVPVLTRALRDRGADLKRKSAAITGNIVSMVSDANFLTPYLPAIIPSLQECLLDPIPDVRATAGKAFGNLIAGIGEVSELVEVVPWLTLTLCSEESPVERSGAAAGLAEVCCSLSGERMGEVISQTLPLAQSVQFTAREGLLWFISSLPMATGDAFAPHVPSCIPLVMEGLNDPVESVREVALRAGQMIAKVMSGSLARLLTGFFCEGIFNDSWRVRNGSLELLGEVLDILASGRNNDTGAFKLESEDISYVWDMRVRMTNITAGLGGKLKSKAIAALYIARTDISNVCRQSALKVWKSLTANTTELAMENMSEIVYEMTSQIGSDSEDIQFIVARALNDTIGKLGDHVLPLVLPEMTEGLSPDNDEKTREGLCMGLAEVFNALSKKLYQEYESILLPCLERAICDSSDKVRTQAASAFSKLTKVAGLQPAEKVVSSLVKKIATSSLISVAAGEAAAESEAAASVRGLKEILQSRPRDVLDFLIPIAVQSPMTLRNALLLETACAAAGDAIAHYMAKILHTIVGEMKILSKEEEADAGARDREAIRETLQKSVQHVMSALPTSALDNCLYEIQVEISNELSAPNRSYGFFLLEQLVRYADLTESDEYVSTILKYILGGIGETDVEVLERVSAALGAALEMVDMAVLTEEIDFVRSCITSTVSDARHRADKKHIIDPTTGKLHLPFFSMRRAFDSMLALFNFGLMNGDAKTRVSSCYGISEILVLCDPASLKPYMSKLTGSLIRVSGDSNKFPAQLKEAILGTMCTCLEVGGAFLKAFAPQLQTTFIKGIKDDDYETRRRSKDGLVLLVKVSPRTDAMLSEVATTASTMDERGVQLSCLEALYEILESLPKCPSAPVSDKIKAALILAGEYAPDFDGDDDRETESLVGRAVERCSVALDALQNQD